MSNDELTPEQACMVKRLDELIDEWEGKRPDSSSACCYDCGDVLHCGRSRWIKVKGGEKLAMFCRLCWTKRVWRSAP